MFPSDYGLYLLCSEVMYEIQQDINSIKSSRILFKTFIKVHNKYRLAKDEMLQHKLYEQASVAGIVFAMPYMADDYYSGEGTGLSKRALQFYDEKGLLNVKRTKWNYRLYGEDDLFRI